MAAKSPTSASAASSRFQELSGKAQSNVPSSSQAKAGVVGRSIGSLIHDGGGVAYLSHDVVFRLFAVFQSGKQTGTQLQFQRLGSLGEPISSVMLSPRPNVQ